MKRALIGERIEKQRAKVGMSTFHLAERIGKSQATISRIENGKQGVSIEILSDIAKALRIHPFALLTDAPLRHSTLLPPGAMRSDGPMRILPRILKLGRQRARLSEDDAALALGIETDELTAIEMGYALPDADVLETMGDLYPVDGKDLADLARLEEDFPAVSERLAVWEHIMSDLMGVLQADPKLIETCPDLGRLREKIESAFGLAGSEMSAERNAHYFSIGHLSDILLKALQDPEFHEEVESLAEKRLAGNKKSDRLKQEESKPQDAAETNRPASS